MDIRIYDRHTRQLETERVFERWFMDFAYGRPWRRFLTTLLWSRRWFSRLYALIQRSRFSRAKMRRFVLANRINCDDLEKPLDQYRSFAEFFTRRRHRYARRIPGDPNVLISPAEARLMAIPIERGHIVCAKGVTYTFDSLTAGLERERDWYGGMCLVFRLAPADYHRFCYFDDGEHTSHGRVPGRLHSVSPLALRRGVPAFHENARDVVRLETRNFGSVIEIDVGALCVGAILQHHFGNHCFQRGAEKGVFALGGSTIVLLFRSNCITVDPDILEHSTQGIETRVDYGEAIGRRHRPSRRTP